MRELSLAVSYMFIRYSTYAAYLASDHGPDVRIATPSQLLVLAFMDFQSERQVDSSCLP